MWPEGLTYGHALQDPETYIHRSGRTGRAGSTGVSVTLVDKKKEGLIPYIQKKAGVNFERIGAPQPAQMAQIAGLSMCSSRLSYSPRCMQHTATQSIVCREVSVNVILCTDCNEISGMTSLQDKSGIHGCRACLFPYPSNQTFCDAVLRPPGVGRVLCLAPNTCRRAL